MVLKKYFQEIAKRFRMQWQKQVSLESRLNARLNSAIDQGNQGYEEIENEIEALKGCNRALLRTIDLISRCYDVDLERSEVNRYRSDSGCTISEGVYTSDNGGVSCTQRDATIDGKKYSFREIIFGEQTKDMNEPYAYIKEGFENGERTFYESYGNGGVFERTEIDLGYENVKTSISGIETKKHNPARDCIRRETRDMENGTTITIDRPIVDEEGHIMGTYHFSEQQDTHKFDENYFKKTTIIESKCKDKDGNDIVLRSEIKNDGRGVITRTDYINEQMVTQAVMNDNEHFFTVTNYKDGQKVNWTRYEEEYNGVWYYSKEKLFDEKGYELDEDQMTGEEHHNPGEFKFEQPEDIFYSQSAFLDGAYMPDELQHLLKDESFDEKATGRDYTSVEYELGDARIAELDKKEKERRNNHKKDIGKDDI